MTADLATQAAERAKAQEVVVANELRKGRSYVTPGGMKYWVGLDAFRMVLADRDALVAVVDACDRYINWDEPRIVPTAAIPTQQHALAIARAALSGETKELA